MRLIDTRKTWVKVVALVVMYSFIFEILYPLNYVFADTGAKQAESSGFSASSTSGLVDKFTGDFSYSLPLMDVEGYPIVLSYNQNVTMQSEASWVGLGWNLNVGSVSRDMRGIPDDFNGEDKIIREVGQKDMLIQGKNFKNAFKAGKKISIGYSWSGVGVGGGLTLLSGMYYSTYTGVGHTLDMNTNFSLSFPGQIGGVSARYGGILGYGISADSQNGIGRGFTVGVNASGFKKVGAGLGASYSSNFNSRSGNVYKSIGLSASAMYNDPVNVRASVGTSVGGTKNYGSFTTVPSVIRPTVSVSSSNDLYRNSFLSSMTGLSFDIGNFGLLYNVENKLDIIENRIISDAYGYFHLGKRKPDEQGGNYPIMDYNQSSFSEYSEEMNVLPFSAPTYDIFQYNSSIGGGAFRAQRSDFGTLMDASVESRSSGNSNSATLGKGFIDGVPAGQVGYVYGNQKGEKESGNWVLDNEQEFLYKGGSSEGFDEAIFFKASGELTPRNTSVLENLGGYEAFHRKASIDKDTKASYALNYLENGKGETISMDINNLSYDANEEVRGVYYNPSTVKKELEKGRETFSSYPENTIIITENSPLIESINRLNSSSKEHHLSAVEVVGTSGEYSYFGIPAYNYTQENVVFSMAGKLNETVFQESGYVPYSDGIDNSVNNSNGRNGFYERTTIPAFAHSFLLTEIRSSDYVDLRNDGLTPDDQGGYYKFNYTRVYGGENPYTWRVPVSGINGDVPIANMDKGLLATEMDDMGSYTYGEKELWYTNSVESKNMIAKFHISEEDGDNARKDGYAVDEKGFLVPGKTARKLDKIELYSKHDLITNGESAEPLQVVEFIYDYSLCKGYEKNMNTYGGDINESGKLTLKEVRIKTGNSDEQALYPYRFEYANDNPDENPGFNVLNIDNWGSYKENDNNYPNVEYPYVKQYDYGSGLYGDSDANLSAKCWKLTKITNPLGGLTEIVYEADTYSYVQNKRAMDLYQVHGYTNMIDLAYMNHQGYGSEPISYAHLRANTADMQAIETRYGADLDNFDSFAGFDKSQALTLPNNVVLFKLRSSYSGGSKSELEKKLINDYFRDYSKSGFQIYKELYLKTRVKIKKDAPEEEDIPAFIDIANSDVTRFNQILTANQLNSIESIGLLGDDTQTEYQYAYVVLDLAQVNDDVSNDDVTTNQNYNVNPIQKNAWEFARLNLPDLMYADCMYDENSNTFDCNYSLNIDWKVVFGRKLNKILNKNDFCKEVNLNHSFIRLNANQRNNFGIKYASTARVKQIKYYDNWQLMSGEYDSEYIWNYDYATASPELTGEEIIEGQLYYGVAEYEPFIGKDVNPFYTWSRYKNKNKKNFPDESKYVEEPTAELVFPAPKIGYEQTVVSFQEQELSSNSGKSVSRFLTAKSYPVIVERTELDIQRYSTPLVSLWKVIELMAVSQGYYVETNNFHGLISDQEIYNSLGQTQSKSKYNYKNIGEKIHMLDRHGKMTKEQVGIEYDVYATSNFSLSTSTSLSVGGDLKFGIPFGVPFIAGPSFNVLTTESGVYSNTLNKVVHHSAILESVETSYLGSKNIAQNEIYDRYSGNVIMSSLRDEYEDKLISLNYPAHWYYDNFRNIHVVDDEWSGISIQNGSISSLNSSLIDNSSFTGGDILFVENSEHQVYAQVLLKNNYATDPQSPLLYAYKLIDPASGESLTDLTGTDFSVKRVKSGRTNRLGQVMQQVTTKDDSFYDLASNTFTFPTENILSVNAVSFKENNQLKCIKKERGAKPGEIINPYLYGVKGHYRISNSFAFQQERISDDPHQTRFDGELENYVSFYSYNPNYNSWRKINQTGHPAFVDESNFGDYRQLGDITRFDEFAKPLEQVDQIGIHATSLFGYNDELKLLPIAQAVNAKNSDIAYVGFEDNNYLSPQLPNVEGHFSFNESILSGIGSLTVDEHHTGETSYLLTSGETAVVSKEILHETCSPNTPEYLQSAESFEENKLFQDAYEIEPCDCVEDFNPTPGKYVISAWVRVPEQDEELTFTSGEVNVTLTGGTTSSVTFFPDGPIIDGWQRVEGVFEISETNTGIDVSLIASANNAYFDDLRIHPFHASMVTMVYDPTTLLPTARHDAYNFSTFYNYDENLSLTRIRVETIEGIKTISEQESGGVKQFMGGN